MKGRGKIQKQKSAAGYLHLALLHHHLQKGLVLAFYRANSQFLADKPRLFWVGVAGHRRVRVIAGVVIIGSGW